MWVKTGALRDTSFDGFDRRKVVIDDCDLMKNFLLSKNDFRMLISCVGTLRAISLNISPRCETLFFLGFFDDQKCCYSYHFLILINDDIVDDVD